MDPKRGTCSNIGNCSLADARKLQEIPPGQDFVCSECGRMLLLQGVGSTARTGISPAALVAGAGAAAVVIGGIAWFLLRGPAPSPPPPVAINQPTPAATKAVPAEHVLLRLAGSNTIGASLGPALAAAYLESLGADQVKILPGGADESRVVGIKDGGPVAITISAHGSGTGFEALGSGTADVAMSSRPVKPAEAEKLSGLGQMTSAANEHVLAMDGIAIIVSKSNPLSSLNKEQLAAVLSGMVTDWSKVQGRPGPIRVYARDEKSGTTDLIQTLVLANAKLAPDAKRFEDSAALAQAVADDPNGVGFVGLPYVGAAKALAIAELGATPLVPNAFTVATEDYPLSRRLLFYTAQSSANPNASRFVEFALGKAGQAVVKRAGFVELTVQSARQDAAKGASGDYSRLTADAMRLSLDFRFVSGSSELDNKARRDLDRVVDFLRDTELTGRGIRLLGFADSSGSPSANVELSKTRAQRVAAAFAERGIAGVTTAGFGAAMPIANNATAEGREKNRRVEVWVAR